MANAQAFVPYHKSVSVAGNPHQCGSGGFSPATAVPDTAVSTEAVLGNINVEEYDIREYPGAGGPAIVLTPCHGRVALTPSSSAFAEQLQTALFSNNWSRMATASDRPPIEEQPEDTQEAEEGDHEDDPKTGPEGGPKDVGQGDGDEPPNPPDGPPGSPPPRCGGGPPGPPGPPGGGGGGPPGGPPH